jgi:hypothetical protein
MKINGLAAIAVITAACALAGCAAIKPVSLPEESQTSYQGQPLTVVTYDPHTGYFQMTAGAAMFGAIGAIAAIAESEKIVGQYNLVTPSIHTAERLTPAVADRLKPSVITPVSYIPEKGKPEQQLAALGGNKGLILDVRTLAWTTAYFPFNWTHYRTMYSAVSRLEDGVSGKIIAVAPCKVMTESDKGAPTYDELYADNASLLKAKYNEAAEDCAQQMATALFTPGAPSKKGKPAN